MMTKRGKRRLAMLATAAVVGVAALATAFAVRGSLNDKKIANAREQGLQQYKEGITLLEEALILDDEALTLYAEKDLEAALEHLGTVVAKVKDDPEVLAAFADCRWRFPMPNSAHIGQSIATAKAAVSLEPDNIATQKLLLNLYGDAGYLTELIDLAQRILAKDPSEEIPRIKLIQALDGLRRTDEALAETEALIEHHPGRLKFHTTRAEFALRLNSSIENIVSVIEAEQDRFADNPEYFAFLAEYQIMALDTSGAIESAKAAAALPPTSAEQVTDLVVLIRDLDTTITRDDPPQSEAAAPSPLGALADELFERALLDPNMGPAVAADEMRRSWWQNRAERAIDFARRVRTPTGSTADLPLWWPVIVLMDAEPDVQAPSVAPFDIEAYTTSMSNPDWKRVLRAMSALAMGENEEVVKSLAGVDSADRENSAVVKYVRGIAMHRMGDLRGAILEFRDVAENMSEIDRSRAWKALGDAYTESGAFKDAELAYSRIPTQREVRGLVRYDNFLKLVERTRDIGDAQRALEMLQDEGTAGVSDDPIYKVRLARALILAGQKQNGLRVARSLIDGETAPDPLGTNYLLQTLQYHEPELAEELLASITEHSDNVNLLSSQASTLASTGRFDEARQLLRARIDERDATAALPYRMALVRVLDSFETEDATPEARRLSDDYPESATAQLSTLKGRSIWNDPAASRIAVSRLREAVGEYSIAWQTFDARATLENDPTQSEIRDVINRLAEVIDKDPDDFDALILTARSYERFAEIHEAEGRDEDVVITISRASSYYDRAAGLGIRAAAFKPHIKMLRSAGQVAEANRVLDRFAEIEFEPRDDPENLYAGQVIERRDLLVQSGRWSEAAQDQSWFANFSDPKSVIYLAQLHERAGETAEAADLVEQFLERGIEDAAIIEACADVLADCGYISRAIEVYRTLPSGGTETEQKIANMLMRVGRPAEAVPLQLRLARETDRVADWITTIRAVTATGDQAATDAIVREALAAHPDSREIAAFSEGSVLRRFSLMLAASISEDAEPELAALRTLAARHGRGEIDDQAMLDELRAFTGINPDVYEGWRLRVEALVIAGRPQQALDAAQEAAEAMPESPSAIRQYTNALRSMGRFDEAVPVAEQLVDLMQPDAFEAQQILAVIEVERREYQRVIDLLAVYQDRLVLASQNDPSPGLMALAVGFAGSGNSAEAESLFLARARTDGVAWHRFALVAASALPDDDLATRRNWLALVTDPSLAGPKANGLLRLARYSGDPSDALSALSIFERSGDASNQDWLWIAARAAAFSGDPVRAEQFHRDLISLAPDEPMFVASLADLLARQPSRTDDALSLIAQAKPDAAGDALSAEVREFCLVTEARAHLTAGRPETAIGILDSRGARGDASPAALSLLAKACLESGNPDRATELVGKAASSAPLEARTAAEIQAIRAQLTP